MTDIFISDLHLSEERPEIYRAFCRFLHDLDDDVQQLYILGDLFEAWVGDDKKNKLSLKLIAELRLLAQRRVRVFFQAGNRDFLIGNKFAKAADIELLNDHHIYDYQGQRILLMHGDLLCTDDKSYLKFRRIVQNPITKGLFRLLPMSLKRKIGFDLRAKSALGKNRKSAEIMDVNQAAVLATMRKYRVNHLIHGHTHRPAVHAFEEDGTGYKRYVLGDWHQELWWIQRDAAGISLHSAPIS